MILRGVFVVGIPRAGRHTRIEAAVGWLLRAVAVAAAVLLLARSCWPFVQQSHGEVHKSSRVTMECEEMVLILYMV